MSPEARAARERKQKIFVVVGGLLLVALLAFQLPKLLGGSGDAGSAAPATTPADGATPVVTPPAATGTAPVSVRESAKLTTFTVFQRKDPFVQQVATAPPVDTGGTADAGKGEGSKTTKFSPAAKGAAATIVIVNGERQVLEPGTKFPAADPMFVLVAEKPGSKSVVVGIAGGAYSGGRKTTTLKVGKPLTLVNTATGASYKITLVSVGTGDAATSKASQEQP
jgi:hypothetical protein